MMCVFFVWECVVFFRFFMKCVCFKSEQDLCVFLCGIVSISVCVVKVYKISGLTLLPASLPPCLPASLPPCLPPSLFPSLHLSLLVPPSLLL